ncbi:DUF421 domain-containing protein [Dyadobacter subterraneus]|uniref:DUF421 domain-containing protein n=1 Tax=Dyadobacter subterraneus TaxID=2773304 RepID=A0ABR9WFF5_9BACT|nr:YetF domain-containing protein [Dyadobacter subterraneus]MBE9464235.1 DUF421 domain-containing protein [Dyadobacter subterraneus]
MKKEDIHLWDVKRILFGEAPEIFLAEVFIRTVLIYALLLLAVRLMGKRMSGQLTISEVAVMLTLGAIVSPAMQSPGVGLLQGAMILFLAFSFQRGLNFFEFKSQKLEKLSHGEMVMIVKDGTMMLKEMMHAKLSRQQLFAVLRSEGIHNLGEVDRVYLESFGMFSIYKAKEPKAGLDIFPPDDEEIKTFSGADNDHQLVCTSCGHLDKEDIKEKLCPVCNSNKWLDARVSSASN